MNRRRIYERDDHTCQYCGNGASSLDHLVPKVLGGSDAWENLVASCGTCNMRKGDAPYPKLAESMGSSIVLGRTSRRHYPPLYWQVQTRGMPHERVPTNPKRGGWFDRTLIELVFTNPGVRSRLARRRRDVAVAKLVTEVPELLAADAKRELDRLVAEGRLGTTALFYVELGRGAT